jgi:ADP-heptose:LPS heptosyltransferase
MPGETGTMVDPDATVGGVETVVVVRGGLAETLQAGALVRTLGDGSTGMRVTLACPSGNGAELARGLSGVDEVLALDALRGADPEVAAIWPALVALRRRPLRCAMVCSPSGADVLLVYAAGIARRVGLARGVAAPLLTDRVPPAGGENRAQAWLRLATALGVERIQFTAALDPGPAAHARAEERLVGSGMEDGRLLVAIAPGSAWGEPPPSPQMRWDSERYAHLANLLARRHAAVAVLVGPAADRAAADAVLLDLDAPVLDLCGELSLSETASVIARCDLVVAGDSPVLHIAAAVGSAAIGLFGPTDGRVRGPYGRAHRVIQGVTPGGGHRVGASTAMRQIRVEDVLAGIEGPMTAVT